MLETERDRKRETERVRRRAREGSVALWPANQNAWQHTSPSGPLIRRHVNQSWNLALINTRALRAAPPLPLCAYFSFCTAYIFACAHKYGRTSISCVLCTDIIDLCFSLFLPLLLLHYIIDSKERKTGWSKTFGAMLRAILQHSLWFCRTLDDRNE